jgi:hypothetical protein
MRLVARMKVCYGQQPCVSTRWRDLAEHFLFAAGRKVGIVDGPDETVRERGVVVGLAGDGALLLRAASDGSDAIRAVHAGSLVVCRSSKCASGQS